MALHQIGANLTGLLVVALALGLWRALSPDVLGRLGACALLVAGAGSFLDGLFRLDCRGIDAACTNDSWHSHAHKIESGFTGAATLVAPLLLGLGSVVAFLWIAFVGARLLQKGHSEGPTVSRA